MRDPLTEPIRCETDDLPKEEAERMQKVFAFILKDVNIEKWKNKNQVLIATPSHDKLNVIGAKPVGECIRCSTKTWISPSSQKVLEASTVVCTDCFLRGIAAVGS